MGEDILLSIVFVLIGLWIIRNPKFFYTITESWKTGVDSVPSETFIEATKFGGGILVMIGLICLFTTCF